MAEETLGSLLKGYLRKKHLTTSTHYKLLCEQIGLDRGAIEDYIKGTSHPSRGTLLKIADALRLEQEQRDALEGASDHKEYAGFLKKTHAERFPSKDDEKEEIASGKPKRSMITMRRAVLLLTAPEDPSQLPYRLRQKDKRYAKVAVRAGVVFGMHDVVVRVTTPEDVSVLDYSQTLFHKGDLRTVETIPLRDDMPIYLDKTFSNEYLGETDYIWATIFIQALGGERDVEFPEIFHEVAEQERFRGGLHLLTAAITVGQFDSMVEVLATKLAVLQKYVREAQKQALKKYGREAHTITYFATHLKREAFVAEF